MVVVMMRRRKKRKRKRFDGMKALFFSVEMRWCCLGFHSLFSCSWFVVCCLW